MNIVSRYKKIEIKIGIRIIGNIERNKKEVIDLVVVLARMVDKTMYQHG